jgi:hypothetical protein
MENIWELYAASLSGAVGIIHGEDSNRTINPSIWILYRSDCLNHITMRILFCFDN